MSVPPTTYQTNCQVTMSDVTLHKSMQICMVVQQDVYRIQIAGYTRARTYITETDLEIYTSRPSILFKFIRGCQFHPINLQTTQHIELGTRFSEVMNSIYGQVYEP